MHKIYGINPSVSCNFIITSKIRIIKYPVKPHGILNEEKLFAVFMLFYHFPAIFQGEVQKYPLTSVIDISTDREGQSVYRGEWYIHVFREVQMVCYNK